MRIVLLCALFFIPGKAIVPDATFENCEFLGNSQVSNQLEVFWTVRRDAGYIDFQICGCSSDANIDEYMGFGLSGSSNQTLMMGADPIIAYVSDSGPMAVDYYLSDYVQCGEGNGVCPDTVDSRGSCTNDVFNVTGFKREGLQCVSYTRRLTSEDTQCDRNYTPDSQQYIVWSVGGVGETAFKHFDNRRASSGDPPITFGRTPVDNCRNQGGLICQNCAPFTETVMNVSNGDATFVANIGSPASSRGYQAIAGQAGWGFSWYINGTLIPRLIVKRGYTYTFFSEGGREEDGNNYHPFYITDSRTGGWLRKSEAQRRAETIFAGFDEEMNPIGVGPYCQILDTPESNTIVNTCGSQEEYFASQVKGNCSSNVPSRGFSWTPDDTTPNTVYYQCATHTNFGYEIMVLPEIAITQAPTQAPTQAEAGANGVLPYAITVAVMAVLTFAL